MLMCQVVFGLSFSMKLKKFTIMRSFAFITCASLSFVCLYTWDAVPRRFLAVFSAEFCCWLLQYDIYDSFWTGRWKEQAKMQLNARMHIGTVIWDWTVVHLMTPLRNMSTNKVNYQLTKVSFDRIVCMCDFFEDVYYKYLREIIASVAFTTRITDTPVTNVVFWLHVSPGIK